jgi:hypothetical protein
MKNLVGLNVLLASKAEVMAPSSLPPDSVILLSGGHEIAAEALLLLGKQGNGAKGPWAILPAPTFFATAPADSSDKSSNNYATFVSVNDKT